MYTIHWKEAAEPKPVCVVIDYRRFGDRLRLSGLGGRGGLTAGDVGERAVHWGHPQVGWACVEHHSEDLRGSA